MVISVVPAETAPTVSAWLPKVPPGYRSTVMESLLASTYSLKVCAYITSSLSSGLEVPCV